MFLDEVYNTDSYCFRTFLLWVLRILIFIQILYWEIEPLIVTSCVGIILNNQVKSGDRCLSKILKCIEKISTFEIGVKDKIMTLTTWTLICIAMLILHNILPLISLCSNIVLFTVISKVIQTENIVFIRSKHYYWTNSLVPWSRPF